MAKMVGKGGKILEKKIIAQVAGNKIATIKAKLELGVYEHTIICDDEDMLVATLGALHPALNGKDYSLCYASNEDGSSKMCIVFHFIGSTADCAGYIAKNKRKKGYNDGVSGDE